MWGYGPAQSGFRVLGLRVLVAGKFVGGSMMVLASCGRRMPSLLLVSNG